MSLLPGIAAAPLRLTRPGLRLCLWSGWLADAPDLLPRLHGEIPWRQETISVWGRSHPVPRLTCWMGEAGAVYRYSGLRLTPEPWTPLVRSLSRRVEEAAGCRFHAVLLNLYRDGDDRMGWHADDEPDLDPEAPIASLSLGATRRFQLRSLRPDEDGRRETIGLDLGDGDLLLMGAPTQRHWQHQLPRRRGVRTPRLNLTFRRLAHFPGSVPIP